MPEQLTRVPFRTLDLAEPFFDSLKEDYTEFATWFHRKADEQAYVLSSDGRTLAFLYLKLETEALTDIEPQQPAARRLKIGTFKVTPHGTKLGERLLKKAFDHAIAESVGEIYITLFPRHTALRDLLEGFGFVQCGQKTSSNGTELVLARRLASTANEPAKYYPLVRASGHAKWLLAVYPQWHTQLFPDSILTTERYDAVADVSHSNSITKTYVCRMDLTAIRSGDLVVIYRTTDNKGPAEYRAVATSLCTVLGVSTRADFDGIEHFVRSVEPTSVFSAADLRGWWHDWGNIQVLQMLYNAAFTRRLTRQVLADECGLNRSERWSCLRITDEQFNLIVTRGNLDGSIVVD